MAYTKKKIKVTITLAEGKFGDTGSNELVLENLRISANILTYNGDAQGQLQLQIWGLPLTIMNQLTTIGPIMTQMRNNRIVVAAGEDGGQMPVVYEGVISGYAYADFMSTPEVPFNIWALSAAFEAVKDGLPKSFPSEAKAADIMEAIAVEMGKTFENNGVDVILPAGSYYSGSPLTQVKECARDAGVYWEVEGNKLAIWPKKNGVRKGDAIKIGPGNGLVGYPVFSPSGIMVMTAFNSDLRLGGKVEIDSSLEVAKGEWCIYKIIHTVESEMPGGQWFSQITCYRMEN